MSAPFINRRLFLSAARRFDWYVDSTRSSAGGGSRLRPFTTLAQVAAVAKDYDRIGLQAGGSWLESLTVTANRLQIAAYGSGASPYIDCRDAISAGSWSKTGGRTNVYQATVTLPNNPSQLGNAWQDETMLTQVASIAACDALAGSCFCSDWTAASATLYVNLSDSSNPGAGVVTVRYAARGWAIGVTGNSNIVRGVKCRGNGHSAGSIRLVGTDQLVDACRLEDCSRHALYFGAGSRVKNSTFYRGRNDIEGSIGLVVWNQSVITAGRCYSEGNTFDMGGLPNGSALLAHDDTLGHLALALTSDNDTVSNSCGIGGDTTTTTITNPILSSSGGLITPAGSATIVNPQGNITGSYRITDSSAGGNLTIIGGAITVAQVGDGVVRASSTSADFNLALTNVAFTLSAYGASNFKVFKIARGTLTVNGCSFGPTLVCPFVDLFECGIGATGVIVSNNNTLPYGANWKLNGTEYRNLANWTAFSGQDSASAYGSLTTLFSDDFNRANGNIGGSWTLLAGAQGAGQIASNMVKSTTGLGTGTFGTPVNGTINHYAKATSKAVASGGKIPVSCRVADTSNYIGCSWGAGYTLTKVVANVGTQIGISSGISEAIGDEVIVAMSGDNGAVYVNKKRAVAPSACNLSGALTSQRAGMPLGSAAVDPLLDDFSCGPTA